MLQFPNTNVLIFKLIFTTSFIKEVSKEHDESAAPAAADAGFQYEEAGYDTVSESDDDDTTAEESYIESASGFPSISIMSHDDWKSGTLLYLRQHFFIPFEALTLISHSMEEYYGRKLICLKVGKTTVSTILIVYHKSILF